MLKVSLITILLAGAIISCSKEEKISPTPTTNKPAPEPAPATVEPIHGIWAGKLYQSDKSIPEYFSFSIQPNGKLDVINTSQQVVAYGNWQLNGNEFKAAFTLISDSTICCVKAEFDPVADKLFGTWGYDASFNDGGVWQMDKVN